MYSDDSMKVSLFFKKKIFKHTIPSLHYGGQIYRNLLAEFFAGWELSMACHTVPGEYTNAPRHLQTPYRNEGTGPVLARAERTLTRSRATGVTIRGELMPNSSSLPGTIGEPSSFPTALGEPV